MNDYRVNSGHDMWREHRDIYGVIEAHIMCQRYLDMQANKKDPEERRFCQELREAMSAEPNMADKPLYLESWDTARKNGEEEAFHDSDLANRWCAGEIDTAIHACRYRDGSYKLEPAVQAMIEHCGEERLSYVLALEVRRGSNLFSAENRAWSDGFDIQNGFAGNGVRTHSATLDEFITCFRETVDRTRAFEKAAAFIVEASSQNTTSGNYITYAGDIPADILSSELFKENVNVIAEMVAEYGAVLDVEVSDDGAIDVVMGLAYCPNYIAMPDEEDEYPDDREILDPLATKNEGLLTLAAEAPELNESELNFKAWQAVTESSRFKWVEDEIVRLNGRGAMYYTGGEDGIYMRIDNDGKLEAGNYEGAIPHIGEAFFKPVVTKQFDSFNEAYARAMEAGGRQFLIDMFSGQEPQPLYSTARGAAEEKPSVMKQIRDAQKAPKPPRKDKTPGKRKDGAEL